MKKLKNTIIILLLAVTLFVGINTLNSHLSNNSTEHQIDLVITNVGFNPIFYPIENNKIPMPKDITINIITAGYSQAELYTLATDNGIVGILSNVNIGKAYNNGLKYKIIAPYYREGLGPDGRTMGQLIIKKDSDINNLYDLYGKKIGIQGAADGSTIAMKTAMRYKYNLDLSKINFVAIESEMAPLLLQKGELDAAMFDSDYILSTDFNETFETLMDFGADLYELYGTVPPAKFFVVRADLYDEKPEVYESVIEYFKENYQWSLDNIEIITQLESDKSGDNYDTLILKTKYATRLDNITQKDLDAYEAFYETAIYSGVIEEIPNLNELFTIPELNNQ
ncbi:MAG: hypothetical protein GQ477_00785 [Nanohaloarchaea archaeon]|nr:hypothetical protein [Candidatus Nanohaloarchaea archaeon]